LRGGTSAVRRGRLTAQFQQAGQSENVIQFPKRQQTSIGGDVETVEIQLETSVKIERRASDTDSPVGCAMIALGPMI
jgi:hypothetical protein